MPYHQSDKTHPINISLLHEALVDAYGGGDWQYIVGATPNGGVETWSEIVTEAQLRTILNAHARLELATDKPIIAADNTDTATITCADPLIASDSQVTVRVYLDNVEYATSVDVDVVSGQVQMTLATEDAGRYLIEIARISTDDTGYIYIRAEET